MSETKQGRKSNKYFVTPIKYVTKWELAISTFRPRIK